MISRRSRKNKDWVCLSADGMPGGAANGDICLNMSSGEFYAYDEENQEWLPLSGGSSSGDSSSGDGAETE